MSKKKAAKQLTKLLKIQSPIVKETAAYVFNVIQRDFPPNFYFHNYSHTLGVVKAAEEIAAGMGLDEEEQELIVLACWFHDTGFVEKSSNHEDKSIELAKAFLSNKKYPEEKIKAVIDLIACTRVDVTPKNLQEQVMKDADLHHLGTEDQESLSALLRLEQEALTNTPIDEVAWLEQDYQFLKEHRYFTAYATATYQPRKIKNLLKIMRRLDELKSRKEKATVRKSEKEEEKKLKKIKTSRPERGIETMFRVSMRNHISLSQIADNKANIVLSINAIIISIVLTTLLPDLSYQQHLIAPTVLLIAVCVLTIVFAILATIPKINTGEFDRKDIEKRKSNLLFFGNFHKMNLDDFEWGFNEMMSDRDFLYGSMTRDFYYLGIALGKKYRYLNICYKIFMYGLIASILSYVLAFFMAN
jgi:predicted metal-dependent HD superfamily phosphohydrolase